MEYRSSFRSDLEIKIYWSSFFFLRFSNRWHFNVKSFSGTFWRVSVWVETYEQWCVRLHEIIKLFSLFFLLCTLLPLFGCSRTIGVLSRVRGKSHNFFSFSFVTDVGLHEDARVFSSNEVIKIILACRYEFPDRISEKHRIGWEARRNYCIFCFPKRVHHTMPHLLGMSEN